MEPTWLAKGAADVSFRGNGAELVAVLVAFFFGGEATRRQLLHQKDELRCLSDWFFRPTDSVS